MEPLSCIVPDHAPSTEVRALTRPAPVAAQDRDLLLLLRDLARRTQLSAPMTVEHACSLADPSSPTAWGLALMRTLSHAATRPFVFHPRGEPRAGFDEAWLISLLRSLQRGDTGSARLLIGSRIGRLGRRPVAFLAQGFAARLAQGGLDGSNLEAF